MKLRWRELLIAFLMAVGIWYIVTGSEKVESQVEVRADYRGLPQGLIVRSGTVNRVSVRVRASVGMIHSLSGRDFACFVDLSSVKKGENTLPIAINQITLPGGVEVIDVTPSRIYLDVDTVESKVVPLRVEIQGDLPGDYAVEANASPAEVKISGASSQVEGVKRLILPLTVEKPLVPGTTESRRLVPLPEGVDSSPAEVKVTLHVGIKRKLVEVTRPVAVHVPEQLGLYLRPDKVRISLAVPDSLVNRAASNEGIKAYAQLERYELGSYSLPVQVLLPEGVELVKVEPAHVSVTVEQKQSARSRPQPGNTPPARARPSGTQPSKAQPAKTQPAKPQPAGTRPAAPRPGR